ncbi:hypothetical protein [Methylocystis parvus]|uniref:Uncharacterized protein n=1 Tax=Methylocystis parvus TaxID=134 RepID=A0A6B8MAW6_9HYPH|nr:hypothetical protein [Methylocystis parvus]QGM97800.1 hypothetical protein F7D14_10190 [Methylocystis parvus]WBK01892.1 hypothetical protein MMG94_09390 [Methylocystis parvus OBBP]
MRGEIDAAEDEIGKLESAKASAPGLFQPLIDDLLTKMATARAAYAECFAIIDVWAAKALDQASAIRAEAEYVRAALSLNPAILGGAVPALRALSTDNVNALLSDRARLERAKRETAPLVPPPPTVINAHDEAEAFERRHAELTAQNRAAAESWHKEREAEEERKRMENNRAALAKHESLVIKIDRAG